MRRTKEQQILINGGTLHRIQTLWRYIVSCLPEEDCPALSMAGWAARSVLNFPRIETAKAQWEAIVLTDEVFQNYGKS